MKPDLPTSLKRYEWILALVLSLGVGLFLIVRATHAGGLWRDEAGGLQLVRMSTMAEFRQNFQFESFPLLFFAVLRGATDLFGTTDAALRILGAGAAALVIAAAWRNARILGTVPLTFLGLVGLNSTFLLWATAARGYGIGCAALLFAVGAAVNTILQSNPKSFAIFGTSWLIAVQLLYFNFVLLGAVAAGVTAVFLARGRIKFALTVLAIGCGIAVSYLPYLVMNSHLDWRSLTGISISPSIVWQKLQAAYGEPKSISPWVWNALLVTGLAIALYRLVKLARNRSLPEFDLLLLVVVTVVLSPLLYYWLIHVVGYPPQPWHYLALLCLFATMIELVLAFVCRSAGARLLRVSLVIALFVLIPTGAWPAIFKRQTNIDLVAHKLTEISAPTDLIVLHPWTFGVSFNWYYRGKARWDTVPIIAEHRSHCFAQFRAKMMQPNPLEDLEREISDTLRSGNRLWLVGDPAIPPDQVVPEHVSIPPDPQFGWSQAAYRNAWWKELVEFLDRHAKSKSRMMTGLADVSGYENVPLWVVDGWRE